MSSFAKPPRGVTRYDWATGDRWWGPNHVHHKHPDEPINYAAWFEWAAKHGKQHRNVPVPDTRLSHPHVVRRDTDRGAMTSKPVHLGG